MRTFQGSFVVQIDERVWIESYDGEINPETVTEWLEEVSYVGTDHQVIEITSIKEIQS